jgi:hypothetical protein
MINPTIQEGQVLGQRLSKRAVESSWF